MGLGEGTYHQADMNSARILLSLVSIICANTYIQATEFHDISAQEFRFAGLFKVFQATFRASPEANVQDPLGDFPKELEFVYARKLKREQLIEAADKILRKTYTESELQKIGPQIAAINEAYKDVRPGDRYALRYDPEKRTTALLRNGQLVKETPGEDFQRIYFSIWLGPDSPFDFQPINWGS